MSDHAYGVYIPNYFMCNIKNETVDKYKCSESVPCLLVRELVAMFLITFLITYE